MFQVPSGSILVLNWGDCGTTTFDSQNITSIVPSSIPAGWEVVDINMYNGTITMQSPAEDTENAVQRGMMTLTGYTPTGGTRSLDIFLAIVDQVDFTGNPSNCYMATKPQHRYIFNPMIGGSNTPLETVDVKLLWQTKSKLIKYLDMKDNVVSFYVDEDANNKGMVMSGNALIGGYNAAGEIIWSWHIWVTNNDFADEENVVTLGGATVMNVNLGAETNSYGSKDPTKIYESYGLYYQWGRKDPFVGPKYYEFNYNTQATLYDSYSYELYLSVAASDENQGTIAWATAHPTTLIKGEKSNGYDWLYTGHDNELWSTNVKTENDPCPTGWRLADASIFAGLSLNSEYDAKSLEELKPLYGVMLTDGTSDYFFAAQGRRNYYDCNLDIFNSNKECPVPWSGYYWTTTSVEGNASALFIDLNTTRSINGFGNNRAMERANALPVRCVKVL